MSELIISAIAGLTAFFIASQAKEQKPQQAIEENVVYPPSQRATREQREWVDQINIDA